MQAKVQIMPYYPNGSKVQYEKKFVSNLKNMQIVGFEQTSTKFIEIFVP